MTCNLVEGKNGTTWKDREIEDRGLQLVSGTQRNKLHEVYV